MKETPILFTGEMVRAILSGAKTETRRLSGLEKLNTSYFKDRVAKVECRDGLWQFWTKDAGASALPVFLARCPYGGKGGSLWVKETFQQAPIPGMGSDIPLFVYRADDPKAFWNRQSIGKWKPSIFMPRAASRITLKIVSVRVERLKDMFAADCVREGIPLESHKCGCEICSNTSNLCPATQSGLMTAFQELWDSINQKSGFGWDSNPWVWIVAFQRIKP